MEVFVTGRIEKYRLDTTLNCCKSTSGFSDILPDLESVLFGWKAETNYKILLGTYYGNTALDYEVLTIDESLQQQGSLVRMALGGYPEIKDHGVSSSGKLALLKDNSLEIYDNSLHLDTRINFSYNTIPRKIFMEGNNAVLVFDSLTHISLRKVDVNSRQIYMNGAKQFIGVDDMVANDYFLINESRVAIYYVNSNKTKTLLSVFNVGGVTEFSKYFQPPFFIKKITPISFGYVLAGIDTKKNQHWTYK
ncbi:MAG: hypothetical protein U5K54_05980 [Cytophagales bacterium]|nr:hypothetical protein [Cytophagales bacterium]